MRAGDRSSGILTATGSTRSRAAFDPGDDPPLTVDGVTAPLHEVRAVSLRWLAGTVLTGVTSIVLMGGALVVALDEHISAAAPVREPATAAFTAERGRKTDRFQAAVDTVRDREIVQVSTVTRQGDRDLVRVRPFVRITTSLLSRSAAGLDDIPPYNPLALFAVEPSFPAADRTDSIYGAQVEGEVTISTVPFPLSSPQIDPDFALSSAEVEAIVRDESRFTSTAPVAFAVPQPIDPTRFDFSVGDSMAISDLAVRITAENVSEIAKSEEPATGRPGSPAAGGAHGALEAELAVAVKKGDTLGGIFSANAIEGAAAATLIAAVQGELGFDDLKPGDTVRLAYGPADDGSDSAKVVRVSLYRDGSHRGTVAMNDAGAYVAAAEPAEDLPPVAVGEEGGGEDEVVASGGGLTLYESLFETAHAQDMPPGLVSELVRMFSFDVDFNGPVRGGDRLEAFYSQDDADADANSAPELLYASLTAGGAAHRLYRFRSADDGSLDYYDETGRSAQKFLMRKPMSGGIFRSGFGMRRHPILGWVKLHSGVDWAAPRGTPIVAAGDGVVAKAGWTSGYGRHIEIQHLNGYVTTYSHQSGFATGIRPGARVRQGQVIGYVGSTGLSTGAHLHYEVHINGRPVDPMRIRLPRDRELTGDELAAFERERARIDTLLGREPEATSAAVASVN